MKKGCRQLTHTYIHFISYFTKHTGRHQEQNPKITHAVMFYLRLSSHLKLKEHYSKLFYISRFVVCTHQCETGALTHQQVHIGEIQPFRQQEYVNC